MIEPIEELRKTAGDALAESMEAGYKALVESQHTRRAIVVNMLFNKAYAAVQQWLANSQKAMRTAYGKMNDFLEPGSDDYKEAFQKAVQSVDGAHNMLVHAQKFIKVIDNNESPFILSQITHKQLPSPDKCQMCVVLCFSAENYSGIYAPLFGGCFVAMFNLIDRVISSHKYPPNTLMYNTAIQLKEKCENLWISREGYFDLPQLSVIQDIIEGDDFKSTLRHEITHHVQYIEGEKFDVDSLGEYYKKYGLPDDYDKFHDVVPFEIDAEMQAQMPAMFNAYRYGYSPTKMAKYLYDYYMKQRMDALRYGDALTPEARAAMSKQCWETAVSMARAITMGYKGKPWDTPRDEIIKHMDDYAV